jgi:hypothetical protein
MRVGQRPQLVLVMFRRLLIACFPDFDREQVIGDLALVNDDVGINRFCEVIVGRDDRSMRKPQRPLAQPVVIAIDAPSRKLLFQMHRQPVSQRALSKIPFEQKGFVRIELAKRGNHLVQLGLHLASEKTF